MSGPPTQATNSVLNLINPPLTEIRMDSGGNGIDMNNAPLVNLPVPSNLTDAATKDYVDNNAGGAGIGIMNAWPGRAIDIPAGYLLCDGSTIGSPGTGAAIEDVEYQQVFEVIKYMLPNTGFEVWGTNVVNLPDMRGRIPVGLDPSLTNNQDGNAPNLGSTNGSYEHTLTMGEMPSHNHTGSTNMDGNHNHTGSSTGGSGNHTHSGSTNLDGNHQHGGVVVIGLGPYATSGGSGTNGSSGFAGNHSHTFTISSSGGHSHSISIVTDGDHSHTLTINAMGSGNAHYNMQPYLVVNWIIRYK